MTTPPEPPTGVDNLQSQPGLVSDRSLFSLRETLESNLPPDVFKQLTQFIPDDETPDELSDEYRERVLEYVNNCTEYREEIRPDSLRELSNLPNKIDRTTAGGWVFYYSGLDVDHDRPESEADTCEQGKYLFFTPETARELEKIIVEQLQQRPYRAAKIPTKPAKKEDWVLCLYQDDNRYWYDLREKYHNPPVIRFRGFKTDAQTRRNEYSDRFKNSS